MYELIPLFGIVFIFGGIVAIVALNLRFKARKLEHEELLKAMELGQKLPTLEVKKKFNFLNDLKTGIILVAVGFGFYAFMHDGNRHMAEIAGIGFIPGFIGIGMIAMALFVKNMTDKERARKQDIE